VLKKFLLSLILFPCLIFGQGRKYSNEFLNIGVDARALGMSNSVIASVNDAGAGYWNPAGLSHVRDSWQAGLMHAEYFASIAQYDYLAYAAPVDALSTVGFTVIRFGVDDILDTTELIDNDGNVDYDRISSFSTADYALIGSYARISRKDPNFRYGGNVKIIYRQIGEFANAVGFGFDLGAQYKWGGWQFGATVRDVTSTFNSWNFNDEKLDRLVELGNELPEENLELTIPRLLLGAGRRFQLNEKYSLHTEMSFDFTFDGQRNTLVSSSFSNIDPTLGLELGYKNFVFLRAGVGNVQRTRDFDDALLYTVQPNMGLGFNYRGISIDYALTDIGNASDALYSNIFSLRFNLAALKRM
jgi:hypothetical protein